MFLERMDRITHAVSVWLERIGIVALLVMLAVTCIDVAGTKCFKAPLLGAIDVVTLSQVVAISFTIAIAQLAGRHIRVELFFSRLSERWQALIDSLISLLQALFFAVIVWRIYMLGRSLRLANEVSATLFVPLYPFVFAISLGFIPICMIFLLNSAHSMTKVFKK